MERNQDRIRRSRHLRQWIVVMVLVVGLVVGSVVAVHDVLTGPHPGLNDFMSRWEGARSYWRDGLNPYGDQASLNIQMRIYGRTAHENEDPGFFAYPFYTLFLVWPLVCVSYGWASAIWMTLLAGCLIGALLMLCDLFRWHLKPWLLGVLMLWTLLYYFAARGLILGQPGLVVYFLEVLVLWALAHERDRLAGAALAVSTFKPQMGFLLVPFLLLWAWRAQRWAFIGAFAAVWGALMLVSFALLPSWFGDWVKQIRNYPSYTAIGSPVWIVMRHDLKTGALGEWAVNAALWAALFWSWYKVLVQGQVKRLDWTIMITLTITNLSAVRTATPHYVVFTIPMVFYFSWLARRYRGGVRWIVVILMLLLVLPWVQFLLTVNGRFEHPSMYLPLPFGMLALLWFTRQQWWEAKPVIAKE
jgi:hypothetical protein